MNVIMSGERALWLKGEPVVIVIGKVVILEGKWLLPEGEWL